MPLGTKATTHSDLGRIGHVSPRGRPRSAIRSVGRLEEPHRTPLARGFARRCSLKTLVAKTSRQWSSALRFTHLISLLKKGTWGRFVTCQPLVSMSHGQVTNLPHEFFDRLRCDSATAP